MIKTRPLNNLIMGRSWSSLECEVIVADYFAMLRQELCGEPYNKAQHRRSLQEKLQNRSEGSIEYKHQNISAILLHEGHVCISGYKPAWNYQGLLEQVVLEWLGREAVMLGELERSLAAESPDAPETLDWRQRFVEPPERREVAMLLDKTARRPRIINYAELEKQNRRLGERGELFVFELERERLTALGRRDLVADVEWTSHERGDGAGYDIRSFDGATDEELFIEVKTTNAGKYQPFMISANEVEFSQEQSDSYALYRVFEFKRDPAVFRLNGAIDQHVNLRPRSYSAIF